MSNHISESQFNELKKENEAYKSTIQKMEEEQIQKEVNF